MSADNLIDTAYQQAVDKKASQLLSYSPAAIIAYPDYGSFTTLINSKEITGGYWHYNLGSGCHHIVFLLIRKTFLFVHRKYLRGVKLDSTGLVSFLSSEEIVDYD